jgi:hypothetical protein
LRNKKNASRRPRISRSGILCHAAYLGSVALELERGESGKMVSALWQQITQKSSLKKLTARFEGNLEPPSSSTDLSQNDFIE